MRRRRFIKSGLIFVPWLVLPHDRVNCASFLPIPTLDHEVYIWAYSWVPTGGGTLGANHIVAAEYFMRGWKGYGLRAKTSRLNLYTGKDLLACDVPLIRDSGFTTESSASFVPADYSPSTGRTGNGATKYINTGLNPSTTTLISTNSIHMGCYVRTKNTDTGAPMAAINGSTNLVSMLIAYGGSNVSTFGLYNEVGPPYFDDSASGVGYYIATRIASNDAKLYKNGSSILSTTTPTGSIPNLEIFIHGVNDHGIPAGLTSRTLAGYHIGSGFTATDCVNANAVMQPYQTRMARAVA